MSAFRTVDPGPALSAWEMEHASKFTPRQLIEIRRLADVVTSDIVRQMMDHPRAERTS